MASKIIVFAPHPDDETLGCGGTIAKKMSKGYEVLVVVMTDGKNSFAELLGIYSDPTPEEVKEIRKEEIRKATSRLGVPERNLLFLDFEDGRLCDYEAVAEEKVADILSDYSPLQVFFPYFKDFNIDHKATNRVVRKAIEKQNLRTTKYQYSIAQRYLRMGPKADSFLNSFRHNMINVDIARFLDLKKAALNEYKSQITVVSSKQKEPLLSSTIVEMHLKAEEIFYQR